ncbi:DsbA family oxidoreductase [Komagataeibacter intermedius]|uniref:DSBA oxidoreductase n=2 Tax=Komagataeibacter intermedius TaxID=66229 RepID=A0A0N0MDZ7_9PROT|nr:DsbA family oxidoreductase [Komagataeibacter intermedius]KPH85876.1 DSBA oxidoreductase [Komagataeibacter intermedius AF2]MCF3637379.1 DsbA family oxidoreductase [Komagataeibacter intermedius]GAN88752.1 DSBA oxidoreductase [Komagataeibacter intermedius TF2]GBQ70191.1 DSBA oxidoreductase [Komagataeibacter intermedius NRIC 0521]
MKLEIWSDYACPYCYIGKRFLEAALAEFEHAGEVEIVFRAFELDPTSGPAVTTTTLDRIMRKYGKSRSDALAMIDHITSMGERCGLDMRYASVRYTNTFDAHRLTKFAEQHERGADMTERLFRAYFTDNAPLADHDVLVGLAQDVGLDGDAVRAMLSSTNFAEDVRRDETHASQAGIHGVPFFAFDGAYGLSGAQPKAQLLAALRQSWNEARKTASESPTTGMTCDSTGCVIPTSGSSTL